MINELEERIMTVIKEAMKIALDYKRCHYSEELAIDYILSSSKVQLHQEAVEQLIEWLKQSEL